LEDLSLSENKVTKLIKKKECGGNNYWIDLPQVGENSWLAVMKLRVP